MSEIIIIEFEVNDIRSLTCSFFATEENMTEEDEEFMLDNFVTFFIAGEIF